MPENSWLASDSSNDRPNNSRLFDVLADGTEALSEPFDDDFEANFEANFEVNFAEDDHANPHPFDRGQAGRRRKAALTLSMVWGGTIALHISSWGTWFVLGLTTLMGIQILRTWLARPLPVPEPLTSEDLTDYPHVSLLVAAKNEEAVLGSLVENLCNLDYPDSCYDLWVIDDNSTDRTADVLDRLAQQYPQLHVIRRPANAVGGKSGALNEVWVKAPGELIAVFDADAQVPPDLLRQVVPLFQPTDVGAVQVRKQIANAATNLWTRGQAIEMVVDGYYQQKRIAMGGLGELRGNGQFVRRTALERCGGWNEQTITDDLDLTFRLHLDGWDVDFLVTPGVGEEGVTRAIGLWHQRNRWAEGGYQRYLDYWRLIMRNRLGANRTADLLTHWMMQYVLPTAMIPDFLMAIVRGHLPILAPMSGLTITFSFVGMLMGMRRVRALESSQRSTWPRSIVSQALYALFGTIYMLHWLPVIASTTMRMSIRPKRLKWVKTAHFGEPEYGNDEVVAS